MGRISLEEEHRRQEKKLEAEARKVQWLEECKSRLMRQEVDSMIDMAW